MDNGKIIDDICRLYGIKKDTELADRLQVPKQTVYRWRQGQKMDLEKLSDAFPDMVLDCVIDSNGIKWAVERKGVSEITENVTDKHVAQMEEQITMLKELLSAKDTVIALLKDKIEVLESRGQ